MRLLKENKQRPWLTPTGVEIPTPELKSICRAWNSATWESYLKWYSGGCREILLTPTLYQQVSEEQIQTIFESFSKTETPAKRNLIERLLSQLPERDAEILRATYLEGRTQVEIAVIFGLSQPRISQIKIGAFLRLKRGLAGDKLIARQFMRGLKDSLPAPEAMLWDQPMDPPLKECRGGQAESHDRDSLSIKNQSLKVAVLRLSPTGQLIVYWMYWRNLPLRLIALRLLLGMNVVAQIHDASVAKAKRYVIQFQTGNQI